VLAVLFIPLFFVLVRRFRHTGNASRTQVP
jgi:hypothetical protein